MKLLAIIFRKELKDMLRDRRTLFFMIVMPFLVIFLIFNLSMRLGRDMEKRAQEKELRVAGLLRPAAAQLSRPAASQGKGEDRSPASPARRWRRR